MSVHPMGPVFTAAESYAAAGLSVIPIKPDGSKKPVVAWKEYQSRIAGPEQRSDWWANGGGYGIAVICGAVSGNCEAIDFDDIDAFNQWSAMVKELDLELGKQLVIAQTPGPGFQCLFRCVTEPPGNTVLARDREGRTLIETRGEGGYVLVSPSPSACHPRHKPYSLVKGSLTALPVLDEGERALLMACASTLTAAVLPDQRVGRVLPASPGGDLRPGDDYSARGDWADLLTRHGWQCTGTRGEVEEWTRPGKTEKGHSATLHAVAPGWFYVFSTGAAPFAPDRAYSLFTAYALLEHDGDFTAAARALAALGYGTPRPQSEARHSSPESPVSQLDPDDGETRPVAARLRELGLVVIADDELDAAVLPDPIFVVEGILPVGYTLLASKPKIGKTRGITGIAQAVSCGGKALGKIDVTAGEVLFLAMESDLQDIQSRLTDIRGGERPTGKLHVATQWPAVQEGGLDLLRHWLCEHPATVLVIIDTIAKIKPPMPRNADIYAEDYRFGAALKRIADEHQVALLGLHHQRKATSDDTFDTMSGTLGVTAACDVLWVLQRTRGQADAVISMTGRKIREQEIAVRQDEHIGTWLYLGDAEEFRRSKERAEVLRVLRATTGSMTPVDIATELGKRPESIRQLLRSMVQAKEVIRTDRGSYRVWMGL